jgi:NADH-quinone oxidoreductase subunit J
MQMGLSDIVFYIFAFISIVSALAVIFVPNPIYSSFFLALVMSILSAVFFMLEAPFVAASQMIVYAGAVMVLFVMVMMLFDLKKDAEDVSKFSAQTFLKIIGCGILCGIFMGTGWAVSPDGTGYISKFTQPKKEAVTLADPSQSNAVNMTNPEEVKKEVVELTQNPQAASEVFKDYTETQKLSLKIFSKYVFAFEILSLLLLVAIIGSVALAKSRGGTHHAVKRRP